MGKYISHLDLLRAFSRSVLRAELPVRYTQGFNPHQIMTFSLPLPIGVTSETEFVDIDFEDTVSAEEIKERLNDNLPPDIRILRAAQPRHKASEITAAKYLIDFFTEKPTEPEQIQSFFEQKTIPVLRKTKKRGEQEVNLKDFIRSVHPDFRPEHGFRLEVTVDAGNERNLKPDLIVSALERYLAPNVLSGVSIHRSHIFIEKDGILKDFC